MKREEAIKILKDFRDKSALFSVRTALDTIIPELNESEDESIRKDIIAILKGQIPYTSEEDAKKYIAWLEKQGKIESTDKIEQKFQVGKNMPTLEKIEKVYDPTIPLLYTDLCTSKSYVEMDGYRICVNDLFNKLPKEE